MIYNPVVNKVRLAQEKRNEYNHSMYLPLEPP